MPQLRRIATIAVFVHLLACRQIVGFTADQPWDVEDAGARVCGLPFGKAACAACAATSCCDESSRCAANAACAPYEACVGACAGDPKCRARCEDDHPPGTSKEGSALAACLAGHCENACGLACGGQLYGVPTEAASACQECWANNACEQQRACGSSVECDAVSRCRVGCSFRLDCIEACYRAHGFPIFENGDTPIGAPDLSLSGLVASFSRCSSECGLGSNWRCARSSPPLPATPKSNAFDFSLQVMEYGTGDPLSGIAVSVCVGGLTDACTNLGGGTTDEQGLVMFRVPQRDPVVAFAGYVEMTSPGTLPFLWSWGYPVTEASVSLTKTFGFFALRSDTADRLIASLGVTPDPSLGTVSISPRDCSDFQMSGVHVTMNGEHPVAPIYNLSVSATETGGDSRDAAFFNVPPGISEFTIDPFELGEEPYTVRVAVRAGYLTRVHTHPSL